MGDFQEQLLSFICGPLLAFSKPEGRSLITQQLFAEMWETEHLLLSLQLQRVASGNRPFRRRSQEQAVAPWSRAPIGRCLVQSADEMLEHGRAACPSLASAPLCPQLGSRQNPLAENSCWL